MKATFRHSMAFVCLVGLIAPTATRGDDASLRSRMQRRVYTNAQGESLPYRLFVPAKCKPKQRYPLIVFLHGAGERGSDNEAQLKHAEVLRFISDEVQAKHPCFLVAPQCPAPSGKAESRDCRWATVYWGLEKPREISGPTKPMALTIELLDLLATQYPIDPDRRYVTGLSMGGYGTFELCIFRPGDFAAGIPVCGGADASKAKQIAHIAFWVFHGAEDRVVPAERSRLVVEGLKAAGANPRYTEYPGVGHNAWAKAYLEPELVDWLFRQRRRAPH